MCVLRVVFAFAVTIAILPRFPTIYRTLFRGWGTPPPAAAAPRSEWVRPISPQLASLASPHGITGLGAYRISEGVVQVDAFCFGGLGHLLFASQKGAGGTGFN